MGSLGDEAGRSVEPEEQLVGDNEATEDWGRDR